MLAFFVTDGNGVLRDNAPAEVLAGPLTSGGISPGRSCMSCHHGGFILKNDMVRAVAATSQTLSAKDKALINSIYPTSNTTGELMQQDSDSYVQAAKSIGLSPEAADPVELVDRLFNQSLSKRQFGAELGLNETEVKAFLKASTSLSADSALHVLSTTGSMSRENMNEKVREYVETVRDWRQGTGG